MLYHYIAVNSENKAIENDYEADNLEQVLRFLSGQGLKPIAVRPVQEVARGTLSFFRGKIKTSDKVFLTKYLALMLRVGTDLLSAINILLADFDKPAMKNFLLEVRENLTQGRPFYQAFAGHPKVFSPVFVNLIKAAEASGSLQKTFEDLSESLQKETELRNKVRSALIYPVILLGVSLAIFVFLVTFALPRIAKVFLESGINPPFFSRIVFGVGLFVNDHILSFALLFIFGGGFCAYFFGWNVVGRRIGAQFISRLPIVRKIHRDLAVQRFASTFSALLKAGLPIIQTTQITAAVVSSEEFRQSLNRIADEGLAKGLTIGEAFRRESVFPRVVTNLVAISEKAGHLEEVLDTLADFYTSSIDANIRALVAILEPVMLLGMGMLVGIIALSIIVPIYQLTTQF